MQSGWVMNLLNFNKVDSETCCVLLSVVRVATEIWEVLKQGQSIYTFSNMVSDNTVTYHPESRV